MITHLSAALINVNSAALPHGLRAALCNQRMRVVEEVRRVRLQQLIDERFHGSQAALRKKIGLGATDSTLSQVLNRSTGSKTKKPKTMGSPMARKIEALCELESGWMDTDPDLWPFRRLDLDKIIALGPRIPEVEFGLLTAAAFAGLDIEKRDGTDG